MRHAFGHVLTQVLHNDWQLREPDAADSIKLRQRFRVLIQHQCLVICEVLSVTIARNVAVVVVVVFNAAKDIRASQQGVSERHVTEFEGLEGKDGTATWR
mgnify:CR=1 FL=1